MKFRNKFLKYKLNSVADDGDSGGGGGDIDNDGDGDSGTPAGDGDGAGSGIDSAWPEDWQAKVSKGDKDLATRAGRYTSPEAVFDALIASQNKLRSGNMVEKLPEKPTDAELKDWRQANDIPNKSDGYKFDDIPDDDKDMVQEFSKSALEQNMTSEQAKSVIAWHYQAQNKAIEDRVELDQQVKQETLDALNVEWGNGFRRNINLIENMLTQIPEDVREDFKGARLPDGTPVFSHPEVMRAFAGMALQLNPAGTLTSVEGDPLKGVTEEIKEIEGFMKSNRKAYFADNDKQSRLRELYDIRENLNRKAG